jgi:hypothetical protein|tara:strand:- start:8331 stop:9275 length:945 start_codon:yes stop_codon:yes gene_type:complete
MKLFKNFFSKSPKLEDGPAESAWPTMGETGADQKGADPGEAAGQTPDKAAAPEVAPSEGAAIGIAIPDDIESVDSEAGYEYLKSEGVPEGALALAEPGEQSGSVIKKLLSDPRFYAITVMFLGSGLDTKRGLMWAASSVSLGATLQNNPEDSGGGVSEETQRTLDLVEMQADPEIKVGPELVNELGETAISAEELGPVEIVALAAAMDGGFQSEGLPEEYAIDTDSIVKKSIIGAVMTSALLGMDDDDKDDEETIAKAEAPSVPVEVLADAAEQPDALGVEEASNFLPEGAKQAKLVAERLKPFIEKGLEIALA